MPIIIGGYAAVLPKVGRPQRKGNLNKNVVCNVHDSCRLLIGEVTRGREYQHSVVGDLSAFIHGIYCETFKRGSVGRRRMRAELVCSALALRRGLRGEGVERDIVLTVVLLYSTL